MTIDIEADGEQRRDTYASVVGGRLVNQKQDRVETVEEVLTRALRATEVFGPERVLLTPDCGFATVADNPITSPRIAEDKLRAIAQAAEVLRRG